MKLSVFLSGIHPDRWIPVFQSFVSATKERDFEFIIVSPYDLCPRLADNPCIKHIKDFGCPSRCYQLGLLACQGDYVIWAVDDGLFAKKSKAIDKAFWLLSVADESCRTGIVHPALAEKCPTFNPAGDPKKNMVSFKYIEAKFGKGKNARDVYWTIGQHQHLRPYGTCGRQVCPPHYWLIMVGLAKREYLLELGGWDCAYEHLGIGAVDFAIRVQQDGANVIIGSKLMDLTHTRGGHHTPVQDGHNFNDIPMFEKIWSDSNSVHRTKIPLDNWKNAPEVWARRFPNGKPE